MTNPQTIGGVEKQLAELVEYCRKHAAHNQARVNGFDPTECGDSIEHFQAIADSYNAWAKAIEHQLSVNMELLGALRNVQKLISEAAMTGFNYKSSDWPERLFASQQTTSAAISKTLSHPIIGDKG